MKSDFPKSQLETPDHEIWFHEILIGKKLQIMKSDFMKPHFKKTPDREIRFHETPLKNNTRSWNPN